MKNLNDSEKNIIDILINYQSFKNQSFGATLLSTTLSSCSNVNEIELLRETIIREYDKLVEISKYSEIEKIVTRKVLSKVYAYSILKIMIALNISSENIKKGISCYLREISKDHILYRLCNEALLLEDKLNNTIRD